MKKASILLSIYFLLLAIMAFGQKDERATYLQHLKDQDSIRRSVIDAYMKKHPKVKREYKDNKGNVHFMHHIDNKTGKPVYYNARKTKTTSQTK